MGNYSEYLLCTSQGNYLSEATGQTSPEMLLYETGTNILLKDNGENDGERSEI